MSPLHFTLSIDGLEDESLVVRSFEGQENFSDEPFQGAACFGFRYQIELASRQTNLLPEQVVDLQAELRIYRNGECVQRVHGTVRAFTRGDIGHHHTYYSLTLVPALERLSLRHNSRIFQQKNTMEIVTILLEEMGIEEFAFALRRKNLHTREFCVQYRETDLAFLNRLAAEEGWIYSFEHHEGKHTLLFSDHSTVLPTLEEPVIHNNLSGGVAEVPYISAFRQQTRSETATVELRDYSFKKPTYNFRHSQFGSDIGYQRDRYEHYDYPGRYKDDDNGKVFSQIRLEYLRRAAQLATGHSNQPLLRPGYRFEMAEHANPEMNRKWVIVAVTHQGTQPQALEEDGGQGVTTYSNIFKVIPSSFSQNWRATPQPKPQIDGAMTATVVGPEGEEIFCDEHGRVKVSFPWDRSAQESNKNRSCWIRVSQGWAGSEYGMMAIPRVGHEVIVTFLNGDPDQPIIIGRTYHAANRPPYTLPDNKTKTVLRSETHQGDGFNELSFEDQAEAEKIYLHAQKDFEADVLNDHTTHIKHDKHLMVDNRRFTQIKRDNHLTIEGESCTQIRGDRTDRVEGKAHQKVGEYALESGGEVHIKSGQKVVLEAGAELTIKAGGSFLKLDASGVSIVGAKIGLNSGGSAGSGCGFSGRAPYLPGGLQANLPEYLQLSHTATDVTALEGPHQLISYFAIRHLNGVAQLFDRDWFSLWMAQAFGYDIPATAYLAFWQDVKQQKIANPSVKVVSGGQAYYNNSDQTIYIGLENLLPALDPAQQESKARLLAILVHEFGHHIDYLLRNHYSEVKGDAPLDEGAAFAVLLSQFDMRHSNDTLVAKYEGTLGKQWIALQYPHVYAELQKQRAFIANDHKSHQGEREYFSAGGTEAMAKQGKYGHRSIEFALKDYFNEKEREQIYYGNWLRDYSQVVDIKVLEFNLDNVIAMLDINQQIDEQQLKLSEYLEKTAQKAQQIKALAEQQLQQLSKRLEEAALDPEGYLTPYIVYIQAQLGALQQRRSALQTWRTELTQQQLPSSLSAKQQKTVTATLADIDFSIAIIEQLQSLLNGLVSSIEGLQGYQKSMAYRASQAAADVAAASEKLDIDTLIRQQAHYIEPFNKLIDEAQRYYKPLLDAARALADIEANDPTGITTGGKRVGAKALSREALTTIVEILGRKEFPGLFSEADNSPYRLTNDKLGAYRPEEHLDNPRGIVAPSNPKYREVFRGDYTEQEGGIDPQHHYKNYFTQSIDYAKAELRLAAQKGRTPQGLIHFGQALHVMEDIYAHTNFVELAINKLLREKKVQSNFVKALPVWTEQVDIGNGVNVYPLTTGVFGAIDTIASLLSVLEKKWDHTSETEKDHVKTQLSIMLVLLNDYKPKIVQYIADIFGLDYSAEDRALDATEALNMAAALDEATFISRKVADAVIEFLFSFLNQLKAFIARQLLDALKNSQELSSPTDPTHTQLAKDPDDHPLHALAAELAQEMVKEMGDAMRLHWDNKLISLDELLSRVDHFFVHPEQITDHSPPYITALLDKIVEKTSSFRGHASLRAAEHYKGHLEHDKQKLEKMAEQEPQKLGWMQELLKWL